MTSFTIAADLERFAAPIIKKHHPLLLKFKLGYVYRKKAQVSGGTIVCGTARKVNPRNKLFHGLDAMIEIAKDVWDQANPKFRLALMDHELSHLHPVATKKRTKQGDIIYKMTIRHHDIEEFADVLERHSAYHSDLRAFIAAYQRSLKPAAKKASKSVTKHAT